MIPTVGWDRRVKVFMYDDQFRIIENDYLKVAKFK